ncbi:MAG: fused MFS/spermidine synthase [Pirellulaceae bacterium]|nr:fused MFS/spermidine synthase [Pirellulaceae bacterium]
MLPFALTIFLSAFLLFQVQPIIARLILPWFGGSPAVWTTCMCFFQLALLAGYLYSDVVARRLRPRVQIVVHVVVMWVTLLALPIIPRESLKPSGEEHPGWAIAVLLLATVGPVYCLLATTGPLIQAWFSHKFEGRSPYRLFALSNFGSLLALLSYPLVFEPTTTIRQQALAWSLGYGLFVISCSWCAVVVWRALDAGGGSTSRERPTSKSEVDGEKLNLWKILGWTFLAMVPSVLLLAVTNELSQDVAVVPMMWIVPLSLYLISFVICFDHSRWYRREVFGTMLILGGVAAIPCIVQPTSMGYLTQFSILNLMLFGACMTCHGELARMKPTPRYLTLFYLMLSVGGALGGVFVVMVAPLIFSRFHELPLAIVAAVLLTIGRWLWDRDRDALTRVMAIVSVLGSLAIVIGFYEMLNQMSESVVMRLGVVAVLIFLATSLLGWQHAVRFLVPDHMKCGEKPTTWPDRVAWLLVFGLLILYSWWLVLFPESVHEWGSLATLLMVLAIWGVAVGTRFRPVVSLTLYANLGVVFAFFVIQIVVVGIFWGEQRWSGRTLAIKRNFFGITGVGEFESPVDGKFLEIFNGRIGHGKQYLREEIKLEPNIYYGPTSGVGLAFREHPKRQAGESLHVGVIGLGTGTLVVWGNAGDTFVYYEINPAVIALADEFFTYRQEVPVKTRTRLGDARMLLEADLRHGQPEGFDLLIVDAFSGDAIPRHLLTKEAMDVYRQHLAPGGVVAFHISNHYLDLEPVVVAAGREFGFDPVVVRDEPDRRLPGNSRFLSSDWLLLSKNQSFLNRPEIEKLSPQEPQREILWTDDFGSLLQILKWRPIF